ncbi:MAG: DUF4336 domain-containing protein [Candidatus Eremiobacterota bacterium]
MKQLAPDLYALDQPLRFMGMQIGVRTTLVRRPDGSLWIHSPGPRVGKQVETLGPVGALVAPNSMHHMSLGAAMKEFPQARAVASPGVFPKHPELELEDLSGQRWGDDLEQLYVEGMRGLEEFAFFHARSATLILTDIGFNIQSSPHMFTRIALTLDGAYGCFSCPRTTHLLVRDRAAFRRSLERILEWPFKRIVVGHGEAVEQDARERFREAFRKRGWLRVSA